MTNVFTYLRLIRVHQWVKNTFLFTPIIFSGMLSDTGSAIRVTVAFFAFSFLSSAAYIFNDIVDADADRLHPKKACRPVASGAIGIPQALVIAALLVCGSLAAGFALELKVFIVMALYLALHVWYTLGLKRTVILDVIAIALGFELRVWAGSVVIGILPSIWLQLCIFPLALFLGFIKRRHEKQALYDKAVEHRGVLAHYTAYLLDQMIMVSATLCIIFYGLYVLSQDITKRAGHNYLAYTIPFVVYGIFRYLYLVHVKKLGGDPGEILASDFPFLLNIVLWVAAVVIILYLPLR